MKKQIPLGTKLTAGFAIMLALTLILGFTSLMGLSGMKDRFDTTAEKTVKRLLLADDIDGVESDMLASQRAMMLWTFVKDPGKAESARQSWNAKADAMEKDLADLGPLLIKPEAKEALSRMRSQEAAWRPIFAGVAQLCAAGKPDDAFKLAREKTVPIGDAITKDAQLVRQFQNDWLTKDKVATADQYSLNRWIAFLVIGLAVGAGVVVLLVARRSCAEVRQMAFDLSQGAEQVVGAAGQVASASQSLAQGASEQAASLEETSSSSAEVASMTQHSAENAKSAAHLMAETSQVVEGANQILGHMVESMNAINTSSGKISKIIKVIDEIAFQTNILALNAAVEAARAGEAGMGFAVVADEVRNLAQRSAQAASDTATLIEESIANSGHGRTRLDEVAQSMNAITERAHKVRELVDEVNAGSQEQARGVEQVSQAVIQMQEVTQRTAASAEESAAASEELSQQAQVTRSVVERLLALVGGLGE